MFRKRKKKQQKSDFHPDCEHTDNHNDFVEREIEGFKVVALQCKKCKTYGRRPTGFVFSDEASLPIPDFDTLKTDTETELYYKLNFLSQILPSRETRVLLARTKAELKTRFDALKYDDPKEGTRKHWLKNQKIMQKMLKEQPE